MAITRRTIEQEASRNRTPSGESRGLAISENIATGIVSFINPKIPMIAPDGLFFSGEEEQERKQAILDMMPSGALASISDAFENVVSATFGQTGRMVEWVMHSIEEYLVPNNTVANRRDFAADIKNATFAEPLASIETELDSSLGAVKSELAGVDLMGIGRKAVANSMETSMLGTSLFSKAKEEHGTAMQRAHAAASVEIRNVLLTNRDPSVPEEAFGAQATALADTLATAITGVPAPINNQYSEITDAYISTLTGLAADYVNDGDLSSTPAYNATQLAAVTEAITAFNTGVGSDAREHAARLSTIEAEVAAINLAGIADAATQEKFRENITALRLDDRMNQTEYNRMNAAIGSDADGIRQLTHGIASIEDTELVEGFTMPDGDGLAVIDIVDSSDFVPDHGRPEGDATLKQSAYSIAMSLGS